MTNAWIDCSVVRWWWCFDWLFFTHSFIPSSFILWISQPNTLDKEYLSIQLVSLAGSVIAPLVIELLLFQGSVECRRTSPCFKNIYNSDEWWCKDHTCRNIKWKWSSVHLLWWHCFSVIEWGNVFINEKRRKQMGYRCFLSGFSSLPNEWYV